MQDTKRGKRTSSPFPPIYYPASAGLICKLFDCAIIVVRLSAIVLFLACVFHSALWYYLPSKAHPEVPTFNQNLNNKNDNISEGYISLDVWHLL